MVEIKEFDKIELEEYRNVFFELIEKNIITGYNVYLDTHSLKNKFIINFFKFLLRIFLID